MVSLYSYYGQNLNLFGLSPKTPSLEMIESFEDFVKFSDPTARFIKNMRPPDKYGHGPVPTQLLWLKDLKGNPKIDFVGRFENYEEDWNKICKILNIDISLPHLNKSQHRDYKTYYNEGLIEAVRKKYREDIKYFKYDF